jgi:meiotically up-regulated gene 157 (Mug157) protein
MIWQAGMEEEVVVGLAYKFERTTSFATDTLMQNGRWSLMMLTK